MDVKLFMISSSLFLFFTTKTKNLFINFKLTGEKKANFFHKLYIDIYWTPKEMHQSLKIMRVL